MTLQPCNLLQGRFLNLMALERKMHSCSSLPPWGRAKGGKVFFIQLAEIAFKSDREMCLCKGKENLCNAGTARFINKYLYIMW